MKARCSKVMKPTNGDGKSEFDQGPLRPKIVIPGGSGHLGQSLVRAFQERGDEVVVLARKPPVLWLQMSTATIYAHRFDAANDEASGVIGGFEPDVPRYWRSSVHIAEEWERALMEAATPAARPDPGFGRPSTTPRPACRRVWLGIENRR